MYFNINAAVLCIFVVELVQGHLFQDEQVAPDLMPFDEAQINKDIIPEGDIQVEGAPASNSGDGGRGLKGGLHLFGSSKGKGSHQNKCDIVGNLAIKKECVKYRICPAYGASASTGSCPYGKHFDHKKRTCVPKDEAECTNVCPNDSTTYPDPNDDNYYLQCKDGVPHPVYKHSKNKEERKESGLQIVLG